MPRLPPLQHRAAFETEPTGFDVWTPLETLSITVEDGLGSVLVAGRPLAVDKETVIEGEYGILKVLLREAEETDDAGYELDYSYLLKERAPHLDGKGTGSDPDTDPALGSFPMMVSGIDGDTDSIDIDVELVEDLPALIMDQENDDRVFPENEVHGGFVTENGAPPGGIIAESASGSLMEGVSSMDTVTLTEMEYLNGNGVWQKAAFTHGKAAITWEGGTELCSS